MNSNSPIFAYREKARRRLPRHVFDYIDGGSFNEWTIKKNSEDLSRICLQPGVLRDVSHIDLSTEVLGQKLPLPIILAPVGFSGLYARRGEIQAAKAAEKEAIPFCLSTVSICSIEEVHKETSAPFWFQFYMLKDKGFCRELLQRASAAGCPVLLFTVDLPVVGVRYRGIHYGIEKGFSSIAAKLGRAWQFASHPRWLIDVVLRGKPLTLGNLVDIIPEDVRNFTRIRLWAESQLDSGLTWKDLEWLRSQWPGKLVIKGILNIDDARKAVSYGCDGIIVSNHAGRHFDSTPSTISVLPYIAEAVGNQIDILFDSGISSGLDVIKAMAFGAKACLIGRAWAFALAAQGEQGVSEVLQILRRELEVALAHLGVDKVKELTRNAIWTFDGQDSMDSI